MICKPDTDLYTYVHIKCNGWSDISFEDCKQKCLKNEIPENCTTSKSNPECHLIQYVHSSGWCHHSESCSRYEKYEGVTIVERKMRKWHTNSLFTILCFFGQGILLRQSTRELYTIISLTCVSGK